jgi:hypothetical protein
MSEPVPTMVPLLLVGILSPKHVKFELRCPDLVSA